MSASDPIADNAFPYNPNRLKSPSRATCSAPKFPPPSPPETFTVPNHHFSACPSCVMMADDR